jgi:alkanesulfonate monooxygenase SsuD/methylene tetrahydromethanopterin reductase-like flavin-dependent oxidoreductase (luciferase family)
MPKQDDTTAPTGTRSFGVAGALPREVVREVAQAAERAGYQSFWANDTPSGDGLAALRAAAAVTSTIRLGVGVIPLDRQPPTRIADRITELGLPVHRLILGVGSGGAPGGVERVRAGVVALRDLTGATLVVGALGPKMCRVAGEVADGVLLNWLVPDHVPVSIRELQQAAIAAGRARPHVAVYVRTALGAAARVVLQAEADRYAGFPAYAAHFARMGVAAIDTAVIGEQAEEIDAGLVAFDSLVDETVVRAIVAEETAAAYLALLRAAAPSKQDG